jgi:ATP-dependent DNA helicase RecG
MVSVVVKGGPASDVRYLDNVSLRGSIPQLVADTLGVIRRHLSAAAIMGERGRVDRLDYPMAAIREAVVNALLHRDYSPITRGTQIQVEMDPEALTIRSPGGLYGGLSVDDLGHTPITSSRNSALAAILPDVHLPESTELVAENRASGIPAMLRLAQEWGLPRPQFTDSPASFLVRLPRSQLFTPAVRAWIGMVAPGLPGPAYEMTLAMLRLEPVSNVDLRTQCGCDTLTASRVLRDLVDRGLAVKIVDRMVPVPLSRCSGSDLLSWEARLGD